MSRNSTLNEKWLPVPGYEGMYQVSDHGRVRSLDRIVTTKAGSKQRHWGRVLTPAASPSGHLRVSLGRLGRIKSKAVHRLVLEAFIGPSPKGHECCHNDGDPANNHLTNIRWDSRTENLLDSVRHGTHYQTAKTHCPRGHKLSSPNLVLAAVQRGRRSCLACDRAHGYIQHRPGMAHDFQRISDGYYDSISIQQAVDDHLDAA